MIPFIAAAPSFDHPLEMLRACHGKILQQCDTLEKLAQHLNDKGCDVQVQQAATGILRYFDTAGQFHHQDEEEDLFPLLRSCPGVNTQLLAQLLSEHEMLIGAWVALRPVLVQLAEGSQAELPACVKDRFIGSYTAHIELENAELLPMATRLLSAQQQLVAGRTMAERRGAHFPVPA